MNVDKLNSVIDYLRAHPEQHDQGTFGEKTPCGTVACLAGWAAMLDGWTPAWGEPYGKAKRGIIAVVPPGKTEDYGESVELAAAVILGMTLGESVAFFYETENLADIEALRDRILNGEHPEEAMDAIIDGRDE